MKEGHDAAAKTEHGVERKTDETAEQFVILSGTRASATSSANVGYIGNPNTLIDTEAGGTEDVNITASLGVAHANFEFTAYRIEAVRLSPAP